MPIAQRSGRFAQRTGVFRAKVGSRKIGDVAYLSTDGFVRPGITNDGLSIQNLDKTVGSTVTVSFSYSDPDLATNPSAAAQAGVVWDAEVTVAAGQAESLGAGLMPTAVKLVFSAATGQAAVVCA